MIADIEDGNFMLRVDMISIPGTGLDLGFGITYNSFNSNLNIGLGKGWTSDLHQSVYEDPSTHNVTYVTATGAKLIFEYDSETGEYKAPKGFAGELTKKEDGTYEIKTIGKEKLTFSSDGKLRKVEKCGGGSMMCCTPVICPDGTCGLECEVNGNWEKIKAGVDNSGRTC
jgi:hypothetical protein